MDIIRKIQYLLFCLLAIGFVACDDDDNNSTETGYEGILAQLAEEVDATAQQLWNSSPLIVNAGRTATLTKIQRYADKCKNDYEREKPNQNYLYSDYCCSCYCYRGKCLETLQCTECHSNC